MKIILALKDKSGTDILEDTMFNTVVNVKNQAFIEKCLLEEFSNTDLAVEMFQTAKETGNKHVVIECNNDGGQFYVDDPTEDDDAPVEMAVDEMLEEVKLVYVFNLDEQWMNNDEEMTGRWAICYKTEENDNYIEKEWLDESFEDNGKTDENDEDNVKIHDYEDDVTNLEEKKISKGYQQIILEESKPKRSRKK